MYISPIVPAFRRDGQEGVAANPSTRLPMGIAYGGQVGDGRANTLSQREKGCTPMAGGEWVGAPSRKPAVRLQ